jgi:hypothetical protein
MLVRPALLLVGAAHERRLAQIDPFLPCPFPCRRRPCRRGRHQPLPNSRKVYVEGSRPDIRVPMREITQADTPAMHGRVEKRIRRSSSTTAPVRTAIPTRRSTSANGLPALRAGWIEERGDTEGDCRAPARNTASSAWPIPEARRLRFGLKRQPRRAKAGRMNVTQMHYATQGHRHAGDGIHRHPREPAPRQPISTTSLQGIRTAGRAKLAEP